MEKKITGRQIRGKSNSAFLIEGIIMYYYSYIRNLQKNTQLINELSKVTGFKVNMQKPVVFLHTNKQLETEIQKAVSFTVTKNRK